MLLLLLLLGQLFLPQLAAATVACAPLDLPMRSPNQILAPRKFDRDSVTAWLAKMRQMRRDCQQAISFNGSMSNVLALDWTKTAYNGPQAHPFDRMFYDPALGNGTGGAGYTVDRWLADLASRYGQISHVLLWAAYPNLGIDDRNLYQYTRSLPGGAEGLSVAIDHLHDRGVHVLLSYLGWDTGTQGPSNRTYRNGEWDPQQMAQLLKDTHADGFNGDGSAGCTSAFYDEAVRIYKPIAMEGEGGLSNPLDLNFDTYGWAEGYTADDADSVNDAPFVDRSKWLSNSKAMQVWSDRYSGSPESRDEAPGIYSPASGNQSVGVSKITEIQVAWFNGQGYETWENVWGVWNQITARDGEALRRVGILLRFFGRLDFLQSLDWEPFSADVLSMPHGVFGSAWRSPSGNETLYTLVNRKPAAITADLLPRSSPGIRMKFYDCYLGKELQPLSTGVISIETEGWGFGCVLMTPNVTAVADELSVAEVTNLRTSRFRQPQTLSTLLLTMAALTTKPLGSFCTDWSYLQQTMVPSPSLLPRPLHNATSGEVFVPGCPSYHFKASGVEIEGAAGSGVDVQFDWEPHPQRSHSHIMQIGAMYVDKHPVTNAEYAEYLAASGYTPRDRANWLKQNFRHGKVKPGWERRPVTYVSVDDAKHYCAFHGKRLPQAYEWQYFAQGTDERIFPWGDFKDPQRTPVLQTNHTNPGPEPVGQHPRGASVYGVEDLISSVWQITSTFEDAHHAALILRGGSNYAPHRDPHTGQGNWYFRQTPRLDSYGTLMTMGPSYDRAGTISFRCVADTVDVAESIAHSASDPELKLACTNARLCLESVVDMCPSGTAMAACTTDLSRKEIVEWAHWGSISASLRGPPWTEPLGQWNVQRNAGDKGLLVPDLRMPGCTTLACDLNTTDLRTWPSQNGWPSDRAVFNWTGGTPNDVAPTTARAGVFSNVGRFEMTIRAPSTALWQLTLYLGLFNWRGDLPFVKQALLRVSSPGQPTVSHNVTHLDGNNNDIKNVAATIIFEGEVTVSFGLPEPDLVCNTAVGSGAATVWKHDLCSFVAWQAATLEEYRGGTGSYIGIR